MEKRIHEIIREKNTKLLNPFKTHGLELAGADHDLEEDLHIVDNILIDFSKDLTLVIYFDLKNTVVSVAIVSIILDRWGCSAKDADVAVNDNTPREFPQDQSSSFDEIYALVEKDNKEENQIKLFFKDSEPGRDMYRYYKLGIIFTTDYYRTL